MNQITIPTFTRHYKYKNKIEEAFTVKYLIAAEIKNHQQNNIINTNPPDNHPIREEKQIEKYPQDTAIANITKEKDEKSSNKEERREERKIQIQRSQFEQLKKHSKLNMKQIIIIQDRKQADQHKQAPKEKRKKYKKAERRQQEEEPSSNIDQKISKGKNSSRGSIKINKEKQNIYDQYIPLAQIMQSRKKGERVYLKGRIEFGEGPKYTGRIISDERQGVLLVEGNNKNRVIHDDKVYFCILKEDQQKTYCKVVHILPEKRQIVGKVELLHGKKIYILNPINARIASINIIQQSFPSKLKNKLSTHYFIADYVGWSIKSQYPQCRVIDQFGKFGDIDVQTTSLLKMHSIEDKQYDNETVKVELKKFFDRIDPHTGEYQIPEEQIAKREDLRNMRIITIDPVNARDFDDALSVQRVGEYFQVGVHIADPSFFLEEGSQIDKQARKRTTSVYLVHRVLPMLPRILCQNLCSLNPGRERLTFTLWIKFDSQSRIVDTPRISRSVIKSKARFTYEQAQDIIEGKVKTQADIQQGFGCVKEEDFDAVAHDIILLNNVSTELRKRRIQRGSLFFQIPKKVFKLDESFNPVSFQIYERKQAHFLVQELMIVANEQVGQILVKQMPADALLRRHKYPGPKKIQRFETFMKKINMPLQMSNTVRVQDQINEVLQKKQTKQSVKDIVKYQMINLLQAADYFITGDAPASTWIHYALNSPVYTHFTSPIRRYPDIIVHRLLASILDKNKKNADSSSLQLIQLCNEKKIQSKRVSNGCEKIFMCLYLRKNQVIAKGIIMDVEQWGIKVCVPKYDFKGIIRFKQMPKMTILEATADPIGRKVLKAQYNGETKIKFILKEMQEIQLQLECKEGFPLDYKISLLMPCPKSLAQRIKIE